MTVSAAVAQTLDELTEQLQDSDAAIVRLAQHYAAAIDTSTDRYGALETFGPKLRLTLESLGATPKQRSAVKGAGREQSGGSLSRIRASRAD